jgi:hypothetical protein
VNSLHNQKQKVIPYLGLLVEPLPREPNSGLNYKIMS